jgi:hypothetical protein
VLSFSLAGDSEINMSLVAKLPGPALDLDVATSRYGVLATLQQADIAPIAVIIWREASAIPRSATGYRPSTATLSAEYAAGSFRLS